MFDSKTVVYLSWIISFSIHLSAFGQGKNASSKSKKKVEIISANSLEVDPQQGKGAKRLIGNVIFKQDDVYMYCDSAYFFNKQNRLDAFNNVRIKQGDSLNLYGDSLHYNGNSKFAKMRGNVKLDNNDIVLNCNHLDYDLQKEFGYYVGGGAIYNKKDKSELTSSQGYYYPKTEFFFLKTM